MTADIAPHQELYIGLMSGTSVDSIDATLVTFETSAARLIDAISYPLSDDLRDAVIALSAPGDNEIERLGKVDRQLGRAFGEAALAVLDSAGVAPGQIRAIGSHGQTIRHRPTLGEQSFTLQIADPNTISELTGITTVADFRRRDIACGGQGAPLAPAFHDAVFRAADTGRAIVNIGGMANITSLIPQTTARGFDTGPGNVLMDAWIQKQSGNRFDEQGNWAKSGQVIEPLLQRMLAHPYFGRSSPKSTGREDFNFAWLAELLSDDYAPQHVQATLLELTAASISQEIEKLPADVKEVYVCGGGAFNDRLMTRLEALLSPRLVSTTQALGIAAEWVEGAAFAWLAKRTLEGATGNLPGVTGASHPTILGAIYPGSLG